MTRRSPYSTPVARLNASGFDAKRLRRLPGPGSSEAGENLLKPLPAAPPAAIDQQGLFTRHPRAPLILYNPVNLPHPGSRRSATMAPIPEPVPAGGLIADAGPDKGTMPADRLAGQADAATAAAPPIRQSADAGHAGTPETDALMISRGSENSPEPQASPRPEIGLQPQTGPEPVAGDLYLAHFDLHERPFSLLPDPDFLFWSPAHRRAHAVLEYGVMTRAPITLITGEVGAGKTTLLHHLLRTLGDDIQVGLIANAQGSRGDLLRWVHMALGQTTDPQATYVDLFAAFQRHLIAQYAAGHRVVLIFDEAQNLDRAMLEELRMFTNINAGKDVLVQLILVGQPELRAVVRRPDMAQFAQRVAASFHLPAMDAKTLTAYVRHRLQVAGGQGDVIRPSALRLIHAASGGVPRLVNQLCDLALVYAYARNQQTVNRLAVQRVLDDGVFFGAPGFVADTEDDDTDDGADRRRGDRHGD